jgi:hypothetical protein
MSEDVKKIVVLCFQVSNSASLFEKAREKRLPGLGRLFQEGTWVGGLTSQGPSAARFATLLTAASPETHAVNRAGDNSRAEYIWEAVQRSSKKTALFGLEMERAPSSPHIAADPFSIAAYLRTNPDWDLCFVFLPEIAAGKPSSEEAVDQAVSGILGVADPETLAIAVGLTDSGTDGFITMAGPGVRQGKFIRRNSKLEDVVPTLCYLGELSVPAYCEGGIIYQALEDPDMKIKELRACRRNYERLKRSSGPSAMC